MKLKPLQLLASLIAFLAMSTMAWAQPYCDQAQGTAGFPSDPTCEAAVCGNDSWCCQWEWDSFCAADAASRPECAACLAANAPAPANDDCANAEVISVNASEGDCPANGTQGSNVGATDDGGAASCSGGGPYDDVWYQFNSGSYTSIGYAFSSFTMGSLVVEVLDGCGGNVVHCAAGMSALANSFVTTTNTDYWFRVASVAGNGGDFTLCLHNAPPPYDPCANIVNISACDVPTGPQVADPGTGKWSLAELGGSAQTPGQERIFTFTPAATGTYDINVTDYVGGNWIDFFWKPATTCDGTGWNYINWAGGTGLLGVDGTGGTAMTLTQGVQYYIMWDTENTAGRTVDFTVQCLPTPPANDDCANAELLTVNAAGGCPAGGTQGSNELATDDGGPASCSGGGPYADVWYRFNSGSYTSVGYSFSAFSFTTLIVEVLDACAGNVVHCASGNSAMENSFLTDTNTDYWIRVGSNQGTGGNFTICLFDAPPPHDPCDNIVNIDCGVATGPQTVTAGAGKWSLAELQGDAQTPGKERIFSFTPTITGTYNLNVTQNDGGNYIEFFWKEATACDGTGWNYVNYQFGTGSLGVAFDGTAMAFTQGVEYYIMWDPEDLNGRTVDFTVGCILDPNTLCDNAIPITTASLPIVDQAMACANDNNINANNVTTSCGSTSYLGGKEALYVFTPDESGEYKIDYAGQTWSGIFVYAGACPTAGGACVGNVTSSASSKSLTVELDAGTTYYIMFDTYPSPDSPCPGTFSLKQVVCEGNAVVVSITADSWPGETSWEIVDASNTVIASGAPSTSNAVNNETVCLSNSAGAAWYGFKIMDSFGDGMGYNANANWELRTTDGKLIMRDEFQDGSSSPMVPGHTPSYGAYHTFALPIGPVDIHPDECEIWDNQADNKVYAAKQGGKNYQGATLNYQFEFINPDSGRVRRTKKPRNYVLWSELTNPDLVANVKYYARVRTDKSGPLTDAHWGAGCEMSMGAPDVCTGLIDDPNNQYYSCGVGVERRFRPNSQIFAWPVYGATKYKFRIFNLGEGYDQEFISNNYKLELSWPANVAPKLRNGYTYQVQVSALVNGVWTAYCASCPVTINNNPSGHLVEVFGDATLWPNPARDGQVNLNIDGITSDVQHITVEVKDIYGQHVYGQEFGNTGDRFTTVLDLPGDMATGVYLVNITINGEMTTKRLSIIR